MSMLSTLQLTQKYILNEGVDLKSLQELLQYLAVGLSFQSSFQILKGFKKSQITKAQATRLRGEFSTLIKGKPKTYLRSRLPLFFIGLVQYSTQALLDIPVASRISTFKDLLKSFDERYISIEALQTLRAMCVLGLNRTYYKNLNDMLDPVSPFFNGQTPKSFSHAVEEFLRLIDDILQTDRPKLVVVEDPDRQLRLLPDTNDPDRQLRLLPDTNGPDIDVVSAPDSGVPSIKIIDTQREPVDMSRTKVPKKAVEGAMGVYRGLLIGVACITVLSTVIFLRGK